LKTINIVTVYNNLTSINVLLFYDEMLRSVSWTRIKCMHNKHLKNMNKICLNKINPWDISVVKETP